MVMENGKDFPVVTEKLPPTTSAVAEHFRTARTHCRLFDVFRGGKKWA
jgi:hypothetical protein